MTRILAGLLDTKEPLIFSRAVESLESLSGHPGEDIRLTAHISAKIHQKTKELGLDPTDSTAKELYAGLQALVKKHDEFLAKAMGADHATNADELLKLAVSMVKKMDIPMKCWALKPSIAKKLVKALPPKRLMKRLGYKSVDSLLKRENIADIIAVAYAIETPAWSERFIRQYRTLKPSGFETRKIDIRIVGGKRWEKLSRQIVHNKRQNILTIKELGVVVCLPLGDIRLTGLALVLSALLVHAIGQIRSSSAFIQLSQVRPHFGRNVQAAIFKTSPIVAYVADQPIEWHSIERHFANEPDSYLPEIFDPYLSVDDLSTQLAEDALYKLEPALQFWQGLNYVGKIADIPVSFNLLDNALSYYAVAQYGQHSPAFMRESLWRELLSRYLTYEHIKDDVLDQLENKKHTGMVFQQQHM